MDDSELVTAAREATAHAHVPYSEYRVGAALEATDGTLFTGCNIENANYSNSLHAEEVALAEAIKEGHREFSRIAVTSSERDGVLPCGMCRQSLTEFCADDFRVLCDEEGAIAEYRLGELLPDAISAETLGR